MASQHRTRQPESSIQQKSQMSIVNLSVWKQHSLNVTWRGTQFHPHSETSYFVMPESLYTKDIPIV
jgi:hypothetical protein